eukprot:TRINITY_DN54897_c0_g1_i1.p1 TRINITY_DN54897_c0_g1~~TRINITY_DN54897_c0_g1_i1.p1  ORF type:complete len:286 (-),score=61.21 TRINITY_DN54897_c0_g1_i1:45-902(-)
MPEVSIVKLSGNEIFRSVLEPDEKLSNLFVHVAEAANGPCKLVLAEREVLPEQSAAASGLVDGSVLTALPFELPPIFASGVAFAAVIPSGKVSSWFSSSSAAFFRESEERVRLQSKLQDGGTLPIDEIRRLCELSKKASDAPIFTSSAKPLPEDLKDELARIVRAWHAIVATALVVSGWDASAPIAIAALKGDASVVFWRIPPGHATPRSARKALSGGVHMYSGLQEFGGAVDRLAGADRHAAAAERGRRRARWLQQAVVALALFYLLLPLARWLLSFSQSLRSQ